MSKGPMRRWPIPGQAQGMSMASAAIWYALGGHAADVDGLEEHDGDWVGRIDLTAEDIAEADWLLREQGFFGLTAAERASLLRHRYVLIGGDSLGFGYVARFADRRGRDAAHADSCLVLAEDAAEGEGGDR